MLKFAVLACFVAVCYAQTPPTRPMIPDDFMAKVDVLRREGMGPGRVEERKGEGMIERNMEMRISREGFKIMGMNGSSFEEGRLDRFDMNEFFDFFKRDTDPKFHCIKHMVPPNAELDGFFGWVHRAVYNGTVMDKGVTYDSWVLIEPDRRELRELWVKPMMVNVPSAALFARRERLGREDEFEEEVITFNSFTPGAPPMDDFKVPDDCNM